MSTKHEMGTCLMSSDKLIAGNKGKRGNDGIVMDGNEQGRVGNDVTMYEKSGLGDRWRL